MSVDLDELFDAMRRQADTITLAGPEPAQRLGRHRNRVRATMTVTVAIVLVAVGVGVAFRPGSRNTLPADRRGPLPTVGTPVPLGPTRTSAVGTDGTRAYAAWARDEDRMLWVAATTLAGGAVAWAPRRLTSGGQPVIGTIAKVIALPSVVIVAGGLSDGTGRLFGLDPATGAQRWQLTGDNWVITGDRVTVLQARTGKISFHDAATGHDLGGTTVEGSQPGREDSPRLLGWATTADEQRLNQEGPPSWFADPRVVVVDKEGTANVWDTRTATRVRDVVIGSGPTQGMAVADGQLFMNRPGDAGDAPVTGTQHLRAVSLTGDGGIWDAGTVPGALEDVGPCGSGRFCVITTPAAARSLVTAFDVRQRRRIWQAGGPTTGSGLSSAGGVTAASFGPGRFALYDAAGQPMLAGTEGVLSAGAPQVVSLWLDPGDLLVMDRDGSGRVARWSVADRKLTPLGTPATRLEACTSTAIRWACVHAGTLTTWNVG